jgi:ribonucleoside-diphosphate reductase alpha chain
MEVIKRDGSKQPMLFDKISQRIQTLVSMSPPLTHINVPKLAIKIIEQLHDQISTSKIDELTAQECAAQSTTHLDFGTLAGRIVISNNHKNTNPSFFEISTLLHQSGYINSNYYDVICQHKDVFQSMIDCSRDYNIDYFGFKTLERAYLIHVRGSIVERPQHMWMRVAIAIHGNQIDLVKETYDLMSQKYFTHATPTLFNAGANHQQLSSCFLVAMKEDSIDGIYDTLKECAQISKRAGGIGLHIHNIRATGTFIDGTGGYSNGIVPMLRVFNETARYVDQGGGKRNGSFSIYLSPDHADIEAWLELKRNTGDESVKARDLFYGLWVSDLFMERVEKNESWSLFCPHQCPGLNDVYGQEYRTLYESYEQQNKAIKKVQARELWFKILDSQMETGTPSLLYKDACNLKSNQKNIGTIKSSNLCTEIIQYSDKNETAVCNLASISLSTFVKDGKFQYDKLYEVTQVVARNLDRLIDINDYPTETAKRSNFRHRPLGIGVQGLADAFFLLDVPFHSEEAIRLNKLMFETMYYAAIETSVELAKKHGPYETFKGSPLSQGQFQFNLWNVDETTLSMDWAKLRKEVMTYGVRNSLMLAPMPTASTSQILGNNECIEPITSNIYVRRTLAGEFVMMNKYLVHELSSLGLWNEQVKNSIIEHHGSVQQLDISSHLKQKYKIVWEMPMKHIIDMAVDRGVFVCQSQSLNLWIKDPTYTILTSMYFYGWRKGLKTGVYYLRRKPKHHTTQFTIAPCETCSA